MKGLASSGGAALSLKANNLKYHLMRDLLQKKSLDEILQLKQRLIQTSKAAENDRKRATTSGSKRPGRKSGKIKEIRFPDAKYTAGPSSNGVVTTQIIGSPATITSHSSRVSSP
jgi:hypothetical protein